MGSGGRPALDIAPNEDLAALPTTPLPVDRVGQVQGSLKATEWVDHWVDQKSFGQRKESQITRLS